jgi:glycosyltransferase involved in cell wall biosynthesis
MSKIIIITNRLVVGGPSVHLKQLVDYFSKKHQILLVYGPPSKGESSMEDDFRENNIEMHKVKYLKKSINIYNDIRMVKVLTNIFEDFKPDIVHTHTYKPGLTGRYVAWKQNVPKIFHTYHGLIFKGYFSAIISRVLVMSDRFFAKKTDTIIVLSESQQNEIVHHYKIANTEKVKIIPLATKFKTVDFTNNKGDIFRETWKVDKSTRILAQVGRLADVKNVSLMIDVFHEIKKKAITKTVLFIVGDGELKENLIDQAQSLHLKVANGVAREDADVVFTSWCKDLVGLYSAMDLLVLTSKSEGTPLNIIEAQIAGVAVLAPQIGGINDMVVDGKTSVLYDKSGEIVPKLLELIDDRTALSEMGNEAAKFATEKYSLDIMLSEYEKLYS